MLIKVDRSGDINRIREMRSRPKQGIPSGVISIPDTLFRTTVLINFNDLN